MYRVGVLQDALGGNPKFSTIRQSLFMINAYFMQVRPDTGNARITVKRLLIQETLRFANYKFKCSLQDRMETLQKVELLNAA
jgi:hypothetical protein